MDIKSGMASVTKRGIRLRSLQFDPQRAVVLHAGQIKRKGPQTVLREAVARFACAYADARKIEPSDWFNAVNLRVRDGLLPGFSFPLNGFPDAEGRVRRVNLFVATGSVAKAPDKAATDLDYSVGAGRLLTALRKREIPFRATEVRIYENDKFGSPWLSRIAVKISFSGSDPFAMSLVEEAIRSAKARAAQNPFASDPSWEA